MQPQSPVCVCVWHVNDSMVSACCSCTSTTITAAVAAAAHLCVELLLGCELGQLLLVAECCLQLCLHACLDSSVGCGHRLQERLALPKVMHTTAAEVASPALLYDGGMVVEVGLESEEKEEDEDEEAATAPTQQACA